MINTSSITRYTLGRSGSSSSNRNSLVLEQESTEALNDQLSFQDIQVMIDFALSGQSAKNHLTYDCPIEVDGNFVSIFLNFHVFPYPIDLDYEVIPGLGTFSEPFGLEKEKEFDLVVPNTDYIDLPFLAENVSLEYLTMAYNDQGTIIPNPEFTVTDKRITFATSHFSVLRCKCTAIGFRYLLTIRLQRIADIPEDADNTYKTNYERCTDTCEDQYGPNSGDYEALPYTDCIKTCYDRYRANDSPYKEEDSANPPVTKQVTIVYENIDASIQGLYMNDDTQEQEAVEVQIQVPECVKAFLEVCVDPDAPDGSGTRYAHNTSETYTKIYYSVCSGKPLFIKTTTSENP